MHTKCPEANSDVLYLLINSKKYFDDLHLTEICILSYLGLLLSIYDGYKSTDWNYSFSYHSLGGPDSAEILNEIETLERNGFIKKSKTNQDFYTITDNINLEYISQLFLLDRFKWRIKYLSAGISACLTKSLPTISRAIKEEPCLSQAEDLGIKTVLYGSNSDKLYHYFKLLRDSLGDVRSNIIVPASIWIDYLTLLSDKRQDEINDR